MDSIMLMLTLQKERDTLAARVKELEAEVEAHKWLARDANLRTYGGMYQENQRLKAANEVMREALEKIHGFYIERDHYTLSMNISLAALDKAAAILETQTKEKSDE